MSRAAIQTYSLVTLTVLTLAVICVVLGGTENGESLVLQKLLYIHLPAAVTTFLACGVVFVASIGHLLQPRKFWDDLAGAAGLVAVIACSILLATGMIWGKEAWGEWWTWSPRLTFSLVLWVLYSGFLIMRPMIAQERRARVSSVYGIVGFLDVPLVYMSVKLLPDVHPASIPMDTSMKRTLLLCMVAAVMLGAGLILSRMGVRRRAGLPTGVRPAGVDRAHEAPAGLPPTVVH